MARLGRRQPFKPIIKTMIQYQPAAPGPPAASAPHVVSFAARERGHRPPSFGVSIRRLEQYAPAPGAAPTAAKPNVVSRVAIDAASRQKHTLRKTFVGIPKAGVVYTPPKVVAPFKIHHDELSPSARTRRHEQQVSTLINALAGSGQLRGTLSDPKLGYVATEGASWGNLPPTTLQEALDRIAAALTALGQTP